MNTLGEAVQEYLSMRRSLGFKLREDGFRLLLERFFTDRCRTATTGGLDTKTTVVIRVFSLSTVQ